ncbi:uncharacterized protein HMPREF1541_09300 [Cyphellophora europaea CBS 101466]|uniref:J domain-containing protein n=1 Tax=Cyphellophora europaea (strain CBS 101466) TaxID=1220924 RepID=W2SBS9_CYPE1|nr:uncharacterized protein HMPREF1541_09300 [Cyphellophora europaea CBS 101466]ETN45468.1 hypothetical protein HMPREF1541_09300 [Cyphellophora europaea CBS 101466]
MSSPIPPDPYEALGVAKDADIAAIRSAHRKLVLKHHPDRIQDPALKEKGKDAFQKIQQAYEILSEPSKRARYDDQIRLATLRKEAMMRDGPTTTRSQTYPMRPAPPREDFQREFSTEDGAFYETRKPRHEDVGASRDRFEEPLRTNSRKHQDYDRAASAKKATEKERSGKSANWSKVQNIVNAGVRLKKDAEKSRSSKTKEGKDRERRSERSEKDNRYRQPYFSEDSDSDTATHVTSSTIKPSRPSPRAAPSSNTRPSTATRRPVHDDESEGSDHSRSKWESNFDKTLGYLEKAAAGAGKRPPFARHESGSYWSSTRRSGSDSDRRPTPTKARRSYEEDPRRPPMPTQNSAPSGLKARVEERIPKPERRSGGSASYSPRDRDDYRKEMPSFSRSQTMPSPRPSSKKDAAPKASSNLKHTETHDSGYGSSSSPHTPDPREESPTTRTTKSRYQIVDPAESDDDRATRIYKMHEDDVDRRRRYASPEPVNEKRRPEPSRINTVHGHTRSKGSRDSPVEPKIRRSESDRHYNSSREKLYGEVDEPLEREPRAYKYGSGEKTNVRSPREPTSSRHDDVRSRDSAPGSRFQADVRGSRRPSVY